jgi:hypothetical protein
MLPGPLLSGELIRRQPLFSLNKKQLLEFVAGTTPFHFNTLLKRTAKVFGFRVLLRRPWRPTVSRDV